MKRLMFLFLALMVAVPAVAQVAPDVVPAHYRDGKLMHATALDTFHFEDTNPVYDSTNWQGYEKVYVPNGSFLNTKRAYVIGAVLFGKVPFYAIPVFRNGDVGTFKALVDTVYSGDRYVLDGVNVPYAQGYPCFTVMLGDLDEIRVTPGSSDTTMCIPLLDYK